MGTTTSVAMMTVTSATVGSQSTCPTLGRSTLRRSCPPPAPCTDSRAPSRGSTSSTPATPPTQSADPRTSSSKRPSSNPRNQPAYTLPIPSTAARRTCLLPTAVPSLATSSLLPTRKWMHTTNQTKPAKCPARLASLTPPHKCPPSSPTTAGPRNACRLMSDLKKHLKNVTKEELRTVCSGVAELTLTEILFTDSPPRIDWNRLCRKLEFSRTVL